MADNRLEDEAHHTPFPSIDGKLSTGNDIDQPFGDFLESFWSILIKMKFLVNFKSFKEVVCNTVW